ncbi:MAG: hypothetical protein ACXV3V_02225, partial [Actinomycetes bacterium]
MPAGALFRLLPRSRAPRPDGRLRSTGGLLPRYDGGGEATSYASFRTDQTRAKTLTFTPHAWTFRIGESCDRDMPRSRMVSYEVNGKTYTSASCSRGLGSSSPTWGQEQDLWEKQYGVHLGQPVT